jgi:hypothetical protein
MRNPLAAIADRLEIAAQERADGVPRPRRRAMMERHACTTWCGLIDDLLGFSRITWPHRDPYATRFSTPRHRRHAGPEACRPLIEAARTWWRSPPAAAGPLEVQGEPLTRLWCRCLATSNNAAKYTPAAAHRGAACARRPRRPEHRQRQTVSASRAACRAPCSNCSPGREARVRGRRAALASGCRWCASGAVGCTAAGDRAQAPRRAGLGTEFHGPAALGSR